jgi:hypothetical protein
VLVIGGSAQEGEVTDEEKRQDTDDTLRITMAASQKIAPATKATITRLYSMSSPFWSV